jgi:peroxiredoxin
MDKYIYIIPIITTIFFSCSSNKNNFKVKGTIKNSKSDKIYLSKLTTTHKLLIDSAKTDENGNFTLSGKIYEPAFFILYTSTSDYIHLIIHPKDKINILTNLQNFSTEYIVEGSADSKLVKKLIDKQRSTLEKITVLSNKFDNIKGSPDFFKKKAELDSAYYKLVKEHKNFSEKLILENPQSMADIMVLYQQLGRNEPLFDDRKDFRYFNLVDSNLARLYPASEAVRSLNSKVVRIREQLNFSIGAIAPNISLPDTGDNITSLYSFRGRYVLLDFWASWNTMSRTRNKMLASIYSKYKDKGFEIYQVSLDRTKESWTNGIEEDRLNWINVSDLKYWSSPVAIEYHIHELPADFLLDTAGRILAKNLNINELDRSLKELFIQD